MVPPQSMENKSAKFHTAYKVNMLHQQIDFLTCLWEHKALLISGNLS